MIYQNRTSIKSGMSRINIDTTPTIRTKTHNKIIHVKAQYELLWIIPHIYHRDIAKICNQIYHPWYQQAPRYWTPVWGPQMYRPNMVPTQTGKETHHTAPTQTGSGTLHVPPAQTGKGINPSRVSSTNPLSIYIYRREAESTTCTLCQRKVQDPSNKVQQDYVFSTLRMNRLSTRV